MDPEIICKILGAWNILLNMKIEIRMRENVGFQSRQALKGSPILQEEYYRENLFFQASFSDSVTNTQLTVHFFFIVSDTKRDRQRAPICCCTPQMSIMIEAEPDGSWVLEPKFRPPTLVVGAQSPGPSPALFQEAGLGSAAEAKPGHFSMRFRHLNSGPTTSTPPHGIF